MTGAPDDRERAGGSSGTDDQPAAKTHDQPAGKADDQSTARTDGQFAAHDQPGEIDETDVLDDAHIPDSTEGASPPTDPLEVVFFDGSPASYGGGSEMLVRLLTRLDADAFEPILLTQHRDALYRRLDGEITTEVVPFPGSLDQYDGQILDQPPHRTLGTGVRLLQYNVRARRVLVEADVLWCANLRSVLTVGPSMAPSSTPVIWNVGLGQPSSGAYRLLNELGFRLADRVFVESAHQARQLFTDRQLDRHADAFEIFHKGIDTDRFSSDRREPPLSGDPLAIGTAGSLTPRKGIDQFVEAAIDLLDDPGAGPEEDRGLRFLVAGEPPHEADETYARDLRRRVDRAGHADEIEFLGWVEDVPSFYDRLDAFVLPSHNEGVPGVVREALSMELPVVATDVGGTCEIVEDGETGLLIEPDDPGQIADAVRRLLAEPERARGLAAAGRAQVERQHSVERYVENYEAFLREVA